MSRAMATARSPPRVAMTKASPMVFTSYPPCRFTTRRTASWCASSVAAMERVYAAHSAVLSWMSVNTRPTSPSPCCGAADTSRVPRDARISFAARMRAASTAETHTTTITAMIQAASDSASGGVGRCSMRSVRLVSDDAAAASALLCACRTIVAVNVDDPSGTAAKTSSRSRHKTRFWLSIWRRLQLCPLMRIRSSCSIDGPQKLLRVKNIMFCIPSRHGEQPLVLFTVGGGTWSTLSAAIAVPGSRTYSRNSWSPGVKRKQESTYDPEATCSGSESTLPVAVAVWYCVAAPSSHCIQKLFARSSGAYRFMSNA
mmetsp:Transcript_17709/g.54950  ORF Transcript_17709/g.54950 Transcript_17709/m.54950 type:complete len:314 (+) Transcript_17709:77-1018(+)